ncbi:MAG: SIS domain-containing protein [Phycisphaerales bacterium]|jgi:D-sedoheptulose 7-phosphate isomerase
MSESNSITRTSLRSASRALEMLINDASTIDQCDAVIDAIAGSLMAGCKVIACGNGGSMCDASHFVEELTGRFRSDRPAIAALAINDAGHITCTANDYGFDFIFSRAIDALGKPGDVLIALSTSGNSPNILKALESARNRGVKSVVLLGKGGGQAKAIADISVIVPGDTSDRIQELHMLLLHIFVEGVEKRMGFSM